MSLFRKGVRGPRQHSPRRVRLRLEELERRLAPATTILLGGSALGTMPGWAVDLVFTATRTGDLSSQVTVAYKVGAASAGPAAESGTATFSPGSATASIFIPVYGNGVSNASRTFSVQLTGVVSVAGADPTFAPTISPSTGAEPISVAVGDLNGDGLPDLAVANAGSNTVSVLLNTTPPGSSTPSFAPAVSFSAGTDPTSVAIGDFNGDGKPDLVVANQFSNTVSVLLNTTPAGSSTPSFAPAVDFSTGNGPYSVAVADLNGDGKPDVAVTDTFDNTVSVLLNATPQGSSAPSFAAPVNLPTGSTPLLRGGRGPQRGRQGRPRRRQFRRRDGVGVAARGGDGLLRARRRLLRPARPRSRKPVRRGGGDPAAATGEPPRVSPRRDRRPERGRPARPAEHQHRRQARAGVAEHDPAGRFR